MLTSDTLSIAESNGNVQTINTTELTSMFPPETPVTPNGHNGSYTIYSESGYTVITPVKNTLPWSQ